MARPAGSKNKSMLEKAHDFVDRVEHAFDEESVGPMPEDMPSKSSKSSKSVEAKKDYNEHKKFQKFKGVK